MNYFAHGLNYVDDPCVLAGTAVPDWVSVVDRSVRVRRRRALAFVEHPDAFLAAVARGIVQHHDDDAWFHAADAFGELNWRLTAACREALPQDEGFRPSFVGHILVELLLDAALIAAQPALLASYYEAMEQVDPDRLQRVVEQMAGTPARRLGWFVQRFCEDRFLYDYADDGKLLFRLNQVLMRVGLTPLPPSFVDVLAFARQNVSARAFDLVSAPQTANC